MPTIKIEPTKEFKIPYDNSPESGGSFAEELAIAANTAEMQVAMGAPLEVDPDLALREKSLLERAIKQKKTDALKSTSTSYAAAAFLREYGQQIATEVSTVRAALTNKLLELANCGDPKYELRAIELLGKHSDVSLFTERSEVTINYKDPDELENAIKERVKRLLNADVIDVTPLTYNLDEELGVAGQWGEGEEEESEEVEEGEEEYETDEDGDE